MNHWILNRLVLVALSVVAVGSCNHADKLPNIVLVSIDTLRWDYLNTYGFAETEFTPATSRLAAHGMVFENAVATAGTTVPSHGSMLTGLYPRLHGARSNLHNKYPTAGTVADSLRQAGYHTGAFVSAGFLIKRGLAEGFETENITQSAGFRKLNIRRGERTVLQAMSWLEGLSPKQPFFLWLHLWEPHGPYDSSDYSRTQLQEYDGFLKQGVSLDDLKKRGTEILLNPEHLRATRAHYAGEVNRADQYLGQLLDFLEDQGDLDNTIVIMTADHGQGLGAKGTLGHGPTHIETVVRVPLILADFRNRQVGRTETRVSVIDIAPTIAAAAGLAKSFDYGGRSLLEPGKLGDDWPYFVEIALRDSKHRNWETIQESKAYDPNAVAVYSGPLKMTYNRGVHRMFETRSDWVDAQEIDPATEPVMADYLTGLIETFHHNTLDLSSDDISEEDLKVLQGLGYVQ